jgi:hypothetical protein
MKFDLVMVTPPLPPLSPQIPSENPGNCQFERKITPSLALQAVNHFLQSRSKKQPPPFQICNAKLIMFVDARGFLPTIINN